MTHQSLAATAPNPVPVPTTTGTDYQAGVCNIGPAEIAQRRRAGHIGLIVTLLVFAVLVVAHVPPIARLIVGLPAAGAASGYLQAALRFCAGFASRGIFNFGALGQVEQVGDEDARRRDRSKANQILAGSLAVGIAVAIIAVILPL